MVFDGELSTGMPLPKRCIFNKKNFWPYLVSRWPWPFDLKSWTVHLCPQRSTYGNMKSRWAVCQVCLLKCLSDHIWSSCDLDLWSFPKYTNTQTAANHRWRHKTRAWHHLTLANDVVKATYLPMTVRNVFPVNQV